MIDTATENKPSLLTIKSGTFHSMVLCVALFLTTTMSPEYYSLLFVLTLAAYVYLYGASIDKSASYVLSPVIGMVLLGIMFSLNNERYDAFKDIWYAGKVIVCFLLGSHIAKKITDLNLFFNVFVWMSLLFALTYWVRFFTVADEITIDLISGSGGLPVISAIAVPLLIFRNRGFVFKGIPFFKLLIVATVMAAFALSFSRTSIGCLFLLICAGAGLFNNMKKFSGYLLLVVVLVLVIAPFLPVYDAHEKTFLGKVQNSFSEISFTDDSDMSKAIANWRGFEAGCAYLEFINTSLPQKIFGRGWGATVDLGQEVQMSEDMSYQYLPILHNGYMHILTKYGVLGVLLYFVFLWRVTIGSRKYLINNNNLTYAWLISGLGLVLAYTSLVITGIFNKGGLDATLVLLGLFFGSASLPLENSLPISAAQADG